MTIQERVLGTAVALDISGRLVLEDGDRQLKEKVAGLLKDGHRQIILNVADVSYVDSAGLGALVGTFLSVRSAAGAVRLVNPTKKLVDLLAMARLTKVVEIAESEAHALDQFGATA